MEKEKNRKKTPVWDPIRKLTRHYQARVKAAHREIDECALKGHSGKINMPNYVQEVVSPLAKALCEQLPDLNITVSDTVELFNGKDGYFKVMVGKSIIGGLSYPGPGVSHINFSVFAHDRPWGKVITISKLSQLVMVICELIEFLDLGNTSSNDNRL